MPGQSKVPKILALAQYKGVTPSFLGTLQIQAGSVGFGRCSYGFSGLEAHLAWGPWADVQRFGNVGVEQFSTPLGSGSLGWTGSAYVPGPVG